MRVTHGKRAGILANWHEPADHLSGNRRRCVAGDVDLLEEAASLEAGAAKRHDGERHDKKGERFESRQDRLLRALTYFGLRVARSAFEAASSLSGVTLSGSTRIMR